MTKIETDYDPGWQEGYAAASGAAQDEIRRLRMEFHREHTEHAITYRQIEVENERLRAQVEETTRECSLQKTDNERLRAALENISMNAHAQAGNPPPDRSLADRALWTLVYDSAQAGLSAPRRP